MFTKAVRETGLKYMMAETVVYSREFLYIKELHDKGELGKIQYLAASHPQVKFSESAPRRYVDSNQQMFESKLTPGCE